MILDILNDPKKSWEQKTMEMKVAYDKLALENCWLRQKVMRMEAQLVQWFGKVTDQ